MRLKLICVAIATALAWGPASAATLFKASLSGTITAQTSEGSVVSPFTVGSTISMSATWTAKQNVKWGATGYSVAGLYSLPATLRITIGDVAYTAGDEKFDGGYPFYTYDYVVVDHLGNPDPRNDNFQLAAPAVIYKDGRVEGVTGNLVPVSSPRPSLYLGSYIGNGYTSCFNIDPGDPIICNSIFSPIVGTSSTFTIGADRTYNNSYQGPTFVGTWDFASSSVVALPEPPTWAMMIGGFGMVGGAMRYRRRPSRLLEPFGSP